MTRTALLAFLVIGAGCKKKADPPPVPAPEATAEHTADTWLWPADHGSQTVYFDVSVSPGPDGKPHVYSQSVTTTVRDGTTLRQKTFHMVPGKPIEPRYAMKRVLRADALYLEERASYGGPDLSSEPDQPTMPWPPEKGARVAYDVTYRDGEKATGSIEIMRTGVEFQVGSTRHSDCIAVVEKDHNTDLDGKVVDSQVRAIHCPRLGVAQRVSEFEGRLYTTTAVRVEPRIPPQFDVPAPTCSNGRCNNPTL